MKFHVTDLITSNSERAHLSPEMFKEIISELCIKYDSQRKAAKAVDIDQSQLSRFFNGIQLSILVKDLLKLLQQIRKCEVVVERIEQYNDYRRKSIAKANAKKKQPSVSFDSIITKNCEEISVDVPRWLDKIKYVKRMDGMNGIVRLESIDFAKDVVIAKYQVFNKVTNSFVRHISILPTTFQFNTETMYLFGLWAGDNTGGGRVGICNKNWALLEKSSELLQRCFKQPQYLLIGNVMGTELDEKDKKRYREQLQQIVGKVTFTVNAKCFGGPVFSISVHNALFKRLLDFLKYNLHDVFAKDSDADRGAFYAGLFDAEGNVNNSKKGVCFRWSAMNQEFVETLMVWLKKDGFHPSYDGANIKIGCRKETRATDFQLFAKLIMPHIIHPQKKHAAQVLLDKTLRNSVENIPWQGVL
jgi:hypothetical protein